MPHSQKQFSLPLAALLLLSCQVCYAKERNFFWEFGLHNGGDRIPTEDMAPPYTNTVKAGGLFSVSLGIILSLNKDLSFTPTLGYKYDFSQNILFDPSKTSWRTYMLHLPLLYRAADWQYGVGLTYHYKPLLSAQKEGYSDEWQFDNSLGTIIKLDYYYNDEDSIGLQYMQIDYTRAGTKTVNGDNLALLWRIRFAL